MLALIICLAVFCFILLLVLGRQDDKIASLSAENGLLKGRMENIREERQSGNYTSVSSEGSLTVADIEDAVRHAGYVPETNDNWVKFMAAGEAFHIDTARLPQIFIHRYYNVQTSDWDMPLLKHAAHLMSDDLIMVKAIFDERPEGTTLRFFVATMDRNYQSFRDNLMAYLGIIVDGNRRMTEIYDKLVEEKNQPVVQSNPFTPTGQQENKLLS